MSSKYQCPACKSKDVIEYDEHIECRECGLEFFIEFLNSEIDEENLLSKQELETITGAFDEFEDKETRKKFLKDSKKDLSDVEDI